MAWSDEPTYDQINTIYFWLNTCLSTNEARAASRYLKETATRREVSYEMRRLYKLHHSHNLTKDACFASEIWEGFDYDGS